MTVIDEFNSFEMLRKCRDGCVAIMLTSANSCSLTHSSGIYESEKTNSHALTVATLPVIPRTILGLFVIEFMSVLIPERLLGKETRQNRLSTQEERSKQQSFRKEEDSAENKGNTTG